MANVKLISDDNCACCSGNGSGVDVIGEIDPRESIVVRAKDGITIGNIFNTFYENGKKVYELDDFTLVKPVLALSNDAGIIEVGVNVATVVFSGSIAAGTYPILSRSITPDPGGLNLNNPFTFNVLNVKRTTPGTAAIYTLQATDDHGNTSTIVIGVPVKEAYYRGYSTVPTLDQTAIKALADKTLVDNILESYGGQHSYVIPNSPGTPKYIQWSGPVTSAPPSSAILNGLPLPLTRNADVVVTNPNDGSITKTYWSVRTTNRLNIGTYNITLL